MRDEESGTTLTVGLVQMALEGELAGNRDKIVRYIHEAKTRGCRVVVFPESALCAPPDTPRAEIDAAISAIRDAVRAAEVYILLCVMYRRTDAERLFNSLLVIAPDGEVIYEYDKLFDTRPGGVPGLFPIDGIPCSAIICADRWIRGVEDLPAVAGSRILFECSDNFASEWVPNLGWYWYVPRAVRNGAHVVFANTATNPDYARFQHLHAAHGHSAVIDPDGCIQAAADGAPDQLLVTTVHVSEISGAEAARRRNHPTFKPFWEVGLAILGGEAVGVPLFEEQTSPAISVTIAAAQMACSRDVSGNVMRMMRLVKEASANGADVVIFPELTVTGARAEDVRRVKRGALDRALDEIRATAQKEGIHVIWGMPAVDGDVRQNCAFVIGPNGELLTRYAQVVVDQPDLFAPGTSTGAMWFRLNGVPSVVTVGVRESLWNEIAELAAVRGAQMHFHLCYDRDVTPQGARFRKQVWVNLAAYHTFTATVNAASPEGLARPSCAARGGSIVWEDYRRQRGAGAYPYCAVPIAEAGTGEQIIYATQTVGSRNPHFDRMANRFNPQMRDWYEMGAHVIGAGTHL